MKKQKRFPVLRKVIRCTALAVLLIVGLPALYLLVFVRDIKPIDDSSLQLPEQSVLPEMQNGYTLLMLASIPYDIRPPEEAKMNEALRSELSKTGRLSEESMKKWMFYYKEKMETMDRAAQLPYSQGPQLSSPGDRIPNFLLFLNFVRYKLQEAREDFELGNAEKALETVKTQFDVARVCEAGDGGTTLIGLMIGIHIKGLALEQLNLMLSGGWLPGDGAGLSAFLEKHRENHDAWRNSFATEYQITKNSLLHDFRKINGADFKDISLSDLGPLVNDALRFVAFRLFLRTERMWKMFYDFYSQYARNSLIETYAGMKFDDPKKYTPAKSGTWEAAKQIFRGEYVARTLASISLPNFERAFVKRCYSDFELEATRLRLAALEYKRDNKQLPPALAALVPGYISSVPADPFDGKPIRYDAARGLIWSVGIDLKDGGGASDSMLFSKEMKEKWSEQKDFVLKIE